MNSRRLMTSIATRVLPRPMPMSSIAAGRAKANSMASRWGGSHLRGTHTYYPFSTAFLAMAAFTSALKNHLHAAR